MILIQIFREISINVLFCSSKSWLKYFEVALEDDYSKGYIGTGEWSFLQAVRATF